MAKEIKAKLKLQIPGGGATPAPPVGSALGQYGVNIMDFVQAFNNDTSSRQGEIVPVEITIYEDNSFSYTTKTAPASYLIKKAVGLNSGSPEPHKEKVANITTPQLETIAEAKMEDLNANDLAAAVKIIAGTARSMGVTVDGEEIDVAASNEAAENRVSEAPVSETPASEAGESTDTVTLEGETEED